MDAMMECRLCSTLESGNKRTDFKSSVARELLSALLFVIPDLRSQNGMPRIKAGREEEDGMDDVVKVIYA